MFCTASTRTESVTNQLECQANCAQYSDCIGIIYSHEIEYTDICDICTDDNMIDAVFDFGFYRRPGKENVYEFQLFLVDFQFEDYP